MVIKLKIFESWETPEERTNLEKPDLRTEPLPEKKDKKPEILLPEILEFKRSHLDLTEFNPSRELNEIREFLATIPVETQSSQRRILVKDFQGRLAKMRARMANAQIEIEDWLRGNQDLPWQDIKDEYIKIIDKHSIPSNMHAGFRNAVIAYVNSREAVKSIVEEYAKASEEDPERRNWEAELFKDLFGRYPSGKVEIQKTMAGLYLRIFDIEDYVFAFNSNGEKKKETEAGTEEKKEDTSDTRARTSGGAQFRGGFNHFPELRDKITLENATLGSSGSSSIVRTHEEEHAIHSNYYPRHLFNTNNSWRFYDRLFSEVKGAIIDYPDFKKQVERYAKEIPADFYASIKTEILAYLKDGRAIDAIERYLEDLGGLYNYFEIYNLGESFPKSVIGQLKTLNLVVIENDKTLTEDDLEGILMSVIVDAWNRYYSPILESAIDSVRKLLDRYGPDRAGTRAIIRLLSQEPLEKWPRLVRILS